MDYELKKMIDFAMKACSPFDEKLGLSMPSSEIMKVDILKFVMYLIAADHVIAPEEVAFVRDYLDWNLSSKEVSEFIIDNNLHTDNYLNDTPLSLVLFVKIDNELFRSQSNSLDMCSLYVKTFKLLGQVFIGIDNDVDKQESENLWVVIKNMLLYINEHSLRYIHTDVTTILNDDSDSIAVCEWQEELDLWGRAVAVPKADLVNEYLEKMGELQSSYEILDTIIKNQVSQSKKEGYIWIQIQFYFDIYDYDDNGQFINHLLSVMEENSYDLCPDGDTREKYCEWTKAYRVLTDLKMILVRTAQQLEEAHENAMESGCAEAYRQAASQITGMRYGIITNSAIDLLAYNAMSNLTLRSQAKKADEQYSKMVSSMAKRNLGIYQSNIESLMYEQYVPVARNAIKLWANEVTENICRHMSECGNKVFDNIYSIDDSMNIINQIKYEDTIGIKQEKLINAIKKCPYNDEIYFKMIDIGLMTSDIYDYACRYSFLRTNLKECIKTKLIDKCRKQLIDIDAVKTSIGFVKGEYSKYSLLKTIYEEQINRLNDGYGVLRECSREKNIIGFLKNKLHIMKEKDFISISEEMLSQKLNEYINQIVDKDMWYLLIDNNMVNTHQIIGITSLDYDIVNEYFSKKIKIVLLEYQKKMQDENNQVQQKKIEINNELGESQKKIDEMEKQISSLRFFDRKQKKILNEMIEDELETQKELNSKLSKTILKWV